MKSETFLVFSKPTKLLNFPVVLLRIYQWKSGGFFVVREFFRATHWDNLVLELLTRLTMTLPSDLLHDFVVIVDHEWKQ